MLAQRIDHEVNPRSRPPRRETTARRFARLFAAFGKWIIEPDRLLPPPPEPERDPTPPKLLEWLRSRDPLPISAVVPPGRKRFLSWLASSEPIPDASTGAGPSEVSIAGWLLSREKLTSNHATPMKKEVSIHGS